MASIFEALAFSEQNNLIRTQVEREGLARDQDVFDLRDRFSSTFAFEQGLGSGLNPRQALDFAANNSTLGGFQNLFATGLGVDSGLLGLQQQQQQARLTDELSSLLLGGSGGNNNDFFQRLLNGNGSGGQSTLRQQGSASSPSVINNSGGTRSGFAASVDPALIGIF